MKKITQHGNCGLSIDNYEMLITYVENVSHYLSYKRYICENKEILKIKLDCCEKEVKYKTLKDISKRSVKCNCRKCKGKNCYFIKFMNQRSKKNKRSGSRFSGKERGIRNT